MNKIDVKKGDVLGIFTVVGELPSELRKSAKHREFYVICNEGGNHTRRIKSLFTITTTCHKCIRSRGNTKINSVVDAVLKKKVYGIWTVLSYINKRLSFGRHEAHFLCRCECGEERYIPKRLLTCPYNPPRCKKTIRNGHYYVPVSERHKKDVSLPEKKEKKKFS